MASSIGIRDDVARLFSGDVPEPTLEERIRETFGRSEDDEIRDLLRKRAAELRYGQGVQAVPLFRATAKKLQEASIVGGGRAVKAEDVGVLSDDPSGVPAGIRMNTPQGPVDVMLDQDQALSAGVAEIRGRRSKLLGELRETGVELPFWERFKRSRKTTEAGNLSNLRDKFDTKGEVNVFNVGDEDGHVIVLQPDGPPALADIKGFGAGSVLGDIADVAADIGEAATGAGIAAGAARLAGRGGAGVAAGIASAADIGANILRQVVSGGAPGEDYPGQSVGESLPERAAQAVITGLGGGAGEAVGRLVVGPLTKKTSLLARSRFAKKLADATKEEVSALTSGTKAGDFLQQSREVEKEISDLIGRKARLSTGQATGVESMLGGEFSLAGSKARPRIIANQRQRLADGAAAMDALVKMTSDNPDLLSDEMVGRQLAEASEQYVGSLREMQESLAVPLYEQAEATAGKLFPNEMLIREAGDIAADYERAAGVTSKIRKAIDFMDDRATDGRLSISDLNQERRFWSKVAGGQIRPSSELSARENVAIGARMLTAFDRSMDAAAELSAEAGQGAEFLARGNRVWKLYAQQIDDFLGKQKGSNKLGIVGKMMGLSGEQRDSEIVAMLRKAPPKQVAGMLRSLEKLPEGDRVVRQAKAQIVKSIFEAGGHKGGAGTIIGERVSRQLPPKMLADAIEAKDPLLQALFANDPASKNKLRAIGRWFDRIAQGPQVPGTQEAPGYADMNIAQALTRLQGIQEIATQKAIAAAKAIPEGVLSIKGWARLTDDQAAVLAATPEGVDAMHELAKAQANPFRARAAYRAARAWIHMLTILGREDQLEGLAE